MGNSILTADKLSSNQERVVPMELISVKIDKPPAINFILGQSHFIKTVEDIHEALVTAVPGIQFGLAFCEASGKCLVRSSGTDRSMVELAQRNAQAVAVGHSFLIFLGEGFYPINVLNAVKNLSEVCGIYCATANPVEVIVAVMDLGRAILGVVDELERINLKLSRLGWMAASSC